MKEKPTWDCKKHAFIETPREMQAFLNEIVEVCKRHGLSISHEDYHGAFIIERYCEDNIEWLTSAHKNYQKKEK